MTGLGRDGGDATGAGMVAVAVAAAQISAALAAVIRLAVPPTIDACTTYTDRLNEFPSLPHHIQSIICSQSAKEFFSNFASARVGPVCYRYAQPEQL
jgi:hypothetical protein